MATTATATPVSPPPPVGSRPRYRPRGGACREPTRAEVAAMLAARGRLATDLQCCRCGDPIDRAEARAIVSIRPAGGHESGGALCESCTTEVNRVLRPTRRPIP